MLHLTKIILAALLLAIAGKTFSQCNNSVIHIADTIVSQACTQNGQINIGVTGGTAPYSFLWQAGYPGSTIATTQNLTQAYAGQYYLTVTDSHGNCTNAYEYLAGAFQLQGFITPDTTCPVHSGGAYLIVNGGSIPYSYLWSNGATTQNITNVAAGNYDATVTDASGCLMVASRTDSTDLQVYAQGELTVNVTGVNPTTCANNNGQLTATVTGGTPTYSYQWASGMYYNSSVNPQWTTAHLNNLAGNTYYFVTVTDARGCVGYGEYDTLVFTNPVSLSTASTPQSCIGNLGTATITANGITGPYSYIWSNGRITQSISSLVAGYYSVTVSDVNSCTNTATISVSYYSPINANLTQVDQQCSYVAGSASVAPTLGTPPYSYLWSNGQTTATASPLAPNYYTVTITDQANCSATAYAYIYNGSAIIPNETSTDQVCNGAPGSITLSPTGGVQPYTYAWSNNQTTSSISNLQTGYYDYTITDANSCQYSDDVFINFNFGLSAQLFTINNPTCPSANGSAYADVYDGSPPYTYLWSNGSTGDTLNNVTGGIYQVTVTQSNNCSVVKSINLYQYSLLSATINVTPATCIFTNDGIATVSLSNGTPPYTYQWGNGSTTATADSLNARWGIGLNVTDANGCQAETYINSVGYQNLDCAAQLSGTVVDDINLNCLQDVGDGYLQNTYVGCSPGHGTITNALGAYKILVPAGNYALTQHSEYRNQGCPQGSIVLSGCAANTTYQDNNFYDWPLNVNDLRVSMAALSQPRPGFTHMIRVYYQNNGLTTVNNAQVSFVYDAGVTCQYSGGGTVDVNTHTVTINCNALAPAFGAGYTDLTFTTPSTTPLGTIQTYTANITPNIADATPNNNTETEQYPVVSSYDPNNLTVAPQGTGTPGYIFRKDSVLKYTIHFQNTGNFYTTIVAIRDTLDSNLDVSSIQIGASSTPVNMQLQDNILIFTFDPLNLPDSTDDPLYSTGVVSFYIKQNKGLPPGAEMHNKAGIYFDFNLPVPTNSTLNTIQDTTSGIQALSNNISMQLMPNPAQGSTNVWLTLQNNFSGNLTVTNLLGQSIYTQNLQLDAGVSTIPLNISNLASGIYLVRIQDENSSASVKLLKE